MLNKIYPDTFFIKHKYNKNIKLGDLYRTFPTSNKGYYCNFQQGSIQIKIISYFNNIF